MTWGICVKGYGIATQDASYNYTIPQLTEIFHCDCYTLKSELVNQIAIFGVCLKEH